VSPPRGEGAAGLTPPRPSPARCTARIAKGPARTYFTYIILEGTAGGSPARCTARRTACGPAPRSGEEKPTNRVEATRRCELWKYACGFVSQNKRRQRVPAPRTCRHIRQRLRKHRDHARVEGQQLQRRAGHVAQRADKPPPRALGVGEAKVDRQLVRLHGGRVQPW
jgi:hypothetical protein